MNAILLASLLSMSTSQTPEAKTAMDFWIGDWEMTGKNRTKPGLDEWTETTATNSIKRIQDGAVIHESFKMEGFTGESWTVLNPRTNMWQQTWVDSSGAYLLFEGGREGDKVILQQTNIPASAGIKNRMIFQDFKSDSFTWRWERKTGVEEWELQWQLNYKKK